MGIPGLLQSQVASLSYPKSKCSVEMIGEFASGFSNIGCPLSCKQPKNDIVEDGEHLGCMSHPELSMILVKRHIAAIMQSIFNAPMPSCQFQESFRISQMSRQTADSVAYLRFGYAEGIGTLPLQLKNLSQLRPITGVSQQVTSDD